MRMVPAALLAGFAMAASIPAGASTFNISTSFDYRGSGLDPAARDAVEDVIGEAVDFWTTRITGYTAEEAFLTGVDVPVGFRSLGTSVIAFVTPTLIYRPSLVSTGMVYMALAPMTINTDFLPAFGADRQFALDVALHELAHAIGFGTLWAANGVYQGGSGQYLGAEGLAAYREEFDPDAAFVPVEISTGFPGSDDAHWAESWAGGQTELMTAFLDSGSRISDTTLLSLRDIGYTTLDSAALAPVPLPGMGLASGLVFAGLLTLGRRRGGPAPVPGGPGLAWLRGGPAILPD